MESVCEHMKLKIERIQMRDELPDESFIMGIEVQEVIRAFLQAPIWEKSILHGFDLSELFLLDALFGA